MKIRQQEGPIPESEFGRDHWSLLAYIETLVVDGHKSVGTMDNRRLRSNPATHPWGSSLGTWKHEYSTRLRGHTADEPNQVLDHDDWDCLDDLETAGLIEVVSTANGFVTVSPRGFVMATAIRAHKANGGSFATFAV